MCRAPMPTPANCWPSGACLAGGARASLRGRLRIGEGDREEHLPKDPRRNRLRWGNFPAKTTSAPPSAVVHSNPKARPVPPHHRLRRGGERQGRPTAPQTSRPRHRRPARPGPPHAVRHIGRLAGTAQAFVPATPCGLGGRRLPRPFAGGGPAALAGLRASLHPHRRRLDLCSRPQPLPSRLRRTHRPNTGGGVRGT